MAGPMVEIEPPVRARRGGGIRDAATFRSNDRIGAAQSVVFQSDGCSFPKLSEHLCYVGDPTPDDKTYDGIVIDDAIGVPFPLYAGVKCTAGPDADELERAKRLLDEGMDRELEAQLFAWAVAGTDVAAPAAAGVQNALGRIEQRLDATYVGRGVILMSRYDATLAGAVGALRDTPDGMPMFTKVGTPVIASGRVTPGVIYGLGAIVVEHGDAEAVETIDPEYNQHYAIAEEVFVLAVDCEFRIKTTIS